MFRKRDEIDSTSRYHPPPRGGCRLGFGGQYLVNEDFDYNMISSQKPVYASRCQSISGKH